MFDFFEMVNKATTYIEDHIAEDIILEEIAKECHVSYYYFIKTFAMITGYTLKEYIRNRRITLASYEVSNTQHRILDIALKYGYNSNEAFSRAFKKIHGINPSEARKRNVTTYTHFPMLTYDMPQQNIISFSYEIIRNINYTFVGKQVYMVEEYGEYEAARKHQLEFIDDFESKYSSESMLYQVKYDLSFDFTEFHYFIGYEQSKYTPPNDNDLETLNINASKAVSFFSKDLDKNLIFKLKNKYQENIY